MDVAGKEERQRWKVAEKEYDKCARFGELAEESRFKWTGSKRVNPQQLSEEGVY